MCVVTTQSHCRACDYITLLPRRVQPCARLLQLVAASPDVYRAGDAGTGLRDTCTDVAYAIHSTPRDDHCVFEERRQRARLERMEHERMRAAEKAARKDAKVKTGTGRGSAGVGGSLFRMRTRRLREEMSERRGERNADANVDGVDLKATGIGAWASKWRLGKERRAEEAEDEEEQA